MLTSLRDGVWRGVLGALVLACALAPLAEASQVRGRFERTLTVSGAANLDVATGSGNIVVKTGSSSKVVVTGKVQVHYDAGTGMAEAEAALHKIQANPPIDQDGNSIRIGHRQGPPYEHVSIDYELEVPEGSGLLARTGSGDLVVNGPLNTVDVKTGSGDARIAQVKGSVRLTTGSGDVDLSDAGSGGADIKTGSGDVSVGLPSQGGLKLSVRTGSGDISTDRALSIQSVNTHHGMLNAMVRGGGASFVIQTGSGDVRIH
jgi:DUF4097 and DUF4098 domain-containing protein YvlB